MKTWLGVALSMVVVTSCAAEGLSNFQGDGAIEKPDYDGSCLSDSSGTASLVYAAKASNVDPNGSLTLTDMVVTGRSPNGYYIQLDPQSSSCDSSKGTKHSGLFVYTNTSVDKPKLNHLVEVSGTLRNYYGQWQLQNSTYLDRGLREDPLPATTATEDIIIQGGADSLYEGVLVQLHEVTVTNVKPAPGAGENIAQNEVELSSGLRIDDFLGYVLDPFPTVNQSYARVTGVVGWKNQLVKIFPRSKEDIIDELPCQPDCMDRNCGLDPICGVPCGDCDGTCLDGVCQLKDSGTTTEDGGLSKDSGSSQDSGSSDEPLGCPATKNCGGRACGPDPVCGLSCGDCKSGTCSEQGQCEAENPNAPIILSLSTNVAAITSGGSVTITAVVTDPDGIDDLIGGTLANESGATYGSFATAAQEGAYSMVVTWAQINVVETIEFQAEKIQTFVATFYDVAGHSTAKSISIRLHCEGISACGGDCYDLQTTRTHCGGCGNFCDDYYGSIWNCVDGKCIKELLWIEDRTTNCTKLCADNLEPRDPNNSVGCLAACSLYSDENADLAWMALYNNQERIAGKNCGDIPPQSAGSDGDTSFSSKSCCCRTIFE